MNQRTINQAVNIATKSALAGNPVESIVWVLPLTAASDPDGAFLIKYAGSLSADESPPWDVP